MTYGMAWSFNMFCMYTMYVFIIFIKISIYKNGNVPKISLINPVYTFRQLYKEIHWWCVYFEQLDTNEKFPNSQKSPLYS